MSPAAKSALRFVVVQFDDDELVYPPVAMEEAGGNSVTIINTLKKPLIVRHGGKLEGPEPITVPPRGSGVTARVTVPLTREADTAGTVFRLTIDDPGVRPLGRSGDPTIIIL